MQVKGGGWGNGGCEAGPQENLVDANGEEMLN